MSAALVSVTENAVRLAGGSLRFFAPAAGGATRVATRQSVLGTIPFLGPHGAAIATVALTAWTAYEVGKAGLGIWHWLQS
jgi:hypothetical protein